MALLERIIPGLMKRNCQRAIHNMALLARFESQRQNLPLRRAILWETLSGASSGYLEQLFIHNPNPQLDWGLKKECRRLNKQNLLHIYFWMLLYQILLFRIHGLEGYDTEIEFPELCIIKNKYIEYIAAELNIHQPPPWHDAWDKQDLKEAALGLYKSMMKILGLSDKPEQRVVRAALFMNETERGYDLVVREIVSKRCKMI